MALLAAELLAVVLRATARVDWLGRPSIQSVSADIPTIPSDVRFTLAGMPSPLGSLHSALQLHQQGCDVVLEL